MSGTFTTYTLNQYTVWSLLGMVSAGTIAIPDMQRPYVWSATQVRDFVDSLYRGYPTGYLIISQNPDIRLKNGEGAHGKQILIDGQQRVTSLATALLGWTVRTASYKKTTIKIAFNPIEERFEVQTAPILNDKRWIADISFYFSTEYSQIKLFVVEAVNRLIFDVKAKRKSPMAFNHRAKLFMLLFSVMRAALQNFQLFTRDFEYNSILFINAHTPIAREIFF